MVGSFMTIEVLPTKNEGPRNVTQDMDDQRLSTIPWEELNHREKASNASTRASFAARARQSGASVGQDPAFRIPS